ncbi:uncharacterized protein LOC117885703 isoform X2 [Trachemys scripta elegans]|uniref:uncharacterized protein LOC117885703 isoform X2 n=1 Tax=Trachemys scripta elegans TaxID=31138 RepID=UPI001557AE4E|nr:uncharacterized protein LOC117885703 isoform X2 [Trachemys scripta elegans]
MAPQARPVSAPSPWLAAPSLPRELSVERVNDLVLSASDSSSGRLAPRHGYTTGNQDSYQVWKVGSSDCLAWVSRVETEYQALVQAMNERQLPKAAEHWNREGETPVIAEIQVLDRDHCAIHHSEDRFPGHRPGWCPSDCCWLHPRCAGSQALGWYLRRRPEYDTLDAHSG